MLVFLFILFLFPVYCYHMNVGSTGLLFSYSLGALAYIKNNIRPTNYTLTGISGGTWCSILFHLEPDLNDHEMLWSVLVGKKDATICLLRRHSMQQFQESVAAKFKNRYRHIDVSDVPLSIVTTKISDKCTLQNVKIDKFDDMDDLINFCMCSSYIPYISGTAFYKTYKNEKYIDGEIYRNKKCIQNCINSKAWGRTYSMKTRLFLDYDTSLSLFNDGWNDAKKYASSYLMK